MSEILGCTGDPEKTKCGEKSCFDCFWWEGNLIEAAKLSEVEGNNGND